MTLEDRAIAIMERMLPCRRPTCASPTSNSTSDSRWRIPSIFIRGSQLPQLKATNESLDIIQNVIDLKLARVLGPRLASGGMGARRCKHHMRTAPPENAGSLIRAASPLFRVYPAKPLLPTPPGNAPRTTSDWSSRDVHRRLNSRSLDKTGMTI